MVRLCLIPCFLFLCSCSSGPQLPGLPERSDLSLDLAVEPVYGNLLADPLNPDANGDVAKVLHRLGQYPEAELLYRRAFLLDPESFRWPYYIAHTQTLSRNYDLAVSSIRQALALDSDYLPAWLALGQATFRSGNIINSKEAFERLEGDGDAGALAAYWMGRLALEQRDWDGEVAELSNAVRLYPEFGRAHYALGIRYKEMSREPDARRHLVLAQQHRLDVPRLDDPLLEDVFGDAYHPLDYALKGQSLLEDGKLTEALAAFRTALKLEPDTVEAHVGLIHCLGRMGRATDAEGQFEQAVAVNPDYDESYIRYGAVLLEKNRFQEAAGQFAEALDVNPYSSEALVYAGYSSEQNGDYEDAARYYVRALEYRPEYRQAHLRLGATLLRQHLDSEARREFAAALENPDSSNPRLLYQIGSAYARSGNRSAAEGYFERARQSAADLGLMDTSWEEEAERWPLE